MPQPVERCSRRFTMGRTVAEVALIEVSKRFGAIEAVRALSLAVADGEFVVLLGPTGAGNHHAAVDRRS
jgi:ABC-type branched-subunit amino acid transport system ATPase component